MKNTFLAIDLGAGSGCAMLGELTDGILNLREIHRFDYAPVLADGNNYWNTDLIFKEIKKTLSLVAENDLPVESIGITSPGADFSLMGDDGILSPALMHDSSKTDGSVDAFTALMSADKIYGQTGVQVSPANSLFQLFTMKQAGYEPLKKAKHLLFIPDIFNYLLTGVIQTEFSMAATSQVYNPVKRMWDHDVLRKAAIPVVIMPRIAEPGTVTGSISNQVSYATGMARIPVVAVASHNMASEVAAIPATGDNWAYIQAGSSCQMGFESRMPIITKKSQQLNFTNHGGAGHVFRVQQNIDGFIMLQQCSEAWESNKYTFEEMMTLAADAKPFACVIDTAHPSFQQAEDMPAAIAAYCETTAQNIPQTHGEIIRSIAEGLTLKFRSVSGQIESLRGIKPSVLYLSGEPFYNEFLCQLTADCCGVQVIVSPDSTTAAGNILVQAQALGIVKNVSEIREITAKSFKQKKYEPGNTADWNAAFEQYLKSTV